jgi:hypothetical protein
VSTRLGLSPGSRLLGRRDVKRNCQRRQPGVGESFVGRLAALLALAMMGSMSAGLWLYWNLAVR